VGVDVAPPAGHLVLQANNGVDHGHIPVGLKVLIGKRRCPKNHTDGPRRYRVRTLRVQTVARFNPFKLASRSNHSSRSIASLRSSCSADT
jgi:hypothetical protein